jgi:PAS domain S-box-containing protein/putative nucleotidyltransferase with HDIG domain
MKSYSSAKKSTKKIRCWETFQCRKLDCPAYEADNPYCWLFPGTRCHDQIQDEFLNKIHKCIGCKVYQTNMDSEARRKTDNMFIQQIMEFRRSASEREEELQNISMELAIGLSEVMEALKKVSLGDPSVRVSEASNIELISQLKNIMNLTAENLENIFNQFLNFSMDFAVYFEVLQRVTNGDLNARVTGRLHTELSQSLQALTNDMIESISREITGHKNAVQALKESEKKYLDLYQNAPDGYHSLAPDGAILEVNNTWVKMLGYEQSEVAGIMKFQDLLAEEGRETFQKAFPQLKEKGKTNNIEYHLKRKDGSLLPVLINDSAIYSDKGEFLKSRSIVRDASERFQFRKIIEQAIDDWRITFDSMPYGVILLNLDFIIKRVNKYFSEIFNCSFTEIINRKCFEIIQSEKLKKNYFNLISHNVISLDTFEFHDTNSNKIYLLYLTPIPDAEGFTKSFVLAMVDITEMKNKEKELDISYKKLNELFEGLIHSFVNAIDAKSSWTKGHSERVTNYALSIAEEMKIAEEELQTLRIAALLHDIGKIGTYDVILDKPKSLTREEFNLINMHPVRGVEILKPIYQLRHLLPVIKHHHERVDGRGYPDGLKGNEIPFLSRIICVADSYDSMTSDRPYRAALGKEHAIAELKKHSGTQFDPDIVEAFLNSVLRTDNFQKAVQN